MGKKSIVGILLTLFLATMLFGCGKDQSAPSHQASTETDHPNTNGKEAITISVGAIKTAGSAPLFIASEKGYFEEEGIQVEYKWFESANATNVAVASNNVDIGAPGLSADLYNMVASGQKVFIVADRGKEKKGYNSITSIVVHKDSDITKVEDLKGKKVGVTAIGSNAHYIVGRILENHGLKLEDIQLVPMNTMSGLAEAIKGKQLDAVVLVATNVKDVVESGYGKVLVDTSDEIEYQTVGNIVSPKLGENNEAVVRFLRAYLKGVRYYDEAVFKKEDGKLVPGENYEEVVSLTSKMLEMPEENIKSSLFYIEPNGELNVEDIKTQLDWYYKQGLISEKLDVKDIVNTEYLEEALKTMTN